jgi:hypothetical protein
MKKIVHLYFYTDSVAFPRIEDQTLEHTWPFMLKDRLEVEFGVRVYPCLRGMGGATIGEIRSIFLRDIGYFRGQGGDIASIVIFNTGVVDAAPLPFTFCLRKIAKIPLIGPRLWHYVQKPLIPNRALLQKIWWYRQTTPGRFRYMFNHMIRQVKRLKMEAISINTPLTPLGMEARSPGLRESIHQYNAIKHQNTDVTHIAMDWVQDEHYLEDGHHFKPEGHRLLADCLLQAVSGILGQQP